MYRSKGDTMLGTGSSIGARLFEWVQWCIIAILFLMAMDFKNRFFYLSFAAFGLMAVYNVKSLCLPRSVIPAVILAVSMALFAPSARNSPIASIRPFAYPFCILIGYNLINSTKDNIVEKRMIAIILALAAGAFGHYLLNMVINWGADAQRNTIDIWLKINRAATAQAALACLMVGVASALLFCHVRKMVKLSAIIALGSVIAYNLQLAGRTLFIFIILALCTAFVVKFSVEKSGLSRMRMIGVGLIVIIVIAILVSTNTFGIVDKFSDSNFYERFYGDFSETDISEDGRLERKINYLRYMTNYPFGGGHIRNIYGYAHDIILDTYDEAGLFAMIAVIIMLCGDLHKCIRIYRSRKMGNDTKVILMTVIVLLMLQFMLEPVLLGTQWLMACYCVISGTLAKVNEVC